MSIRSLTHRLASTRFPVLGWLVMLGLAVPGPARAQSEFDELSATFTTRLARVEATYQEHLVALPGHYAAGLDALIGTLRTEGALDLLLVVTAEKQRFETEKTVPPTADTKTLGTIRKLQEEFRTTSRRLELEKNQTILDLAKRYNLQLEALQKRLTQEGRINEAVRVKTARDGIYQLPAVSAADFAVGAMTPNSSAGQPVPGVGPDRFTPCPTCKGAGKSQTTCESCSGSGRCVTCRGTGKLKALIASGSRICLQCKGSAQCRACDGSGKVNSNSPCPTCQGKGSIRSPKP